jgi:pilus assembly protein Flp/PilA
MRKFLNTVKRFSKDEEGAALVEYAVLLGVLVAGTIVAIGTLGTSIGTAFTAASSMMTPAAP